MEEKRMEEWMKDRIVHGERKCDQPRMDWEWMRFPGSSMKSEMTEQERHREFEAEFETDGDLRKSIPQLVCDFNVEVLKLSPRKVPEERIILTAQKRMVAMMAQVAMNNEKVSDRMLGLTRRIEILSWIIAILTFVILVVTFIPKMFRAS